MSLDILRTERRTATVSPDFDDRDALAWILGVDESTDFIAETLNRYVLHAVDARSDRFAGLLSTRVLDTVLGSFGLRAPDIRLVRHDRDVTASEYEWRGLVDPVRAARLFAEGATIIFGALHDRHAPLQQLCSAFSKQAGARTQTNIYLTPPGSQGFKVHWDTHDVFVLQVEGSKRWRLYEGGPAAPLVTQKFNPDEHEHGAVIAEFEMTAGDVLYIPRGVMHAAECGEEPSLHITLGVMAYTWSHLAVDVFQELALRSEPWRENLPFGWSDAGDGVDPAAVADELKRKVRDSLAELDIDFVIGAKRDQIGGAFRPREADYLAQAAGVDALEPGDTVCLRPGLHVRVEERGDRVVVLNGSREIDLPAVAKRLVNGMIENGAGPAGEIDDGLDWPGRRVVLTTMIREGLVTRTPGGR